MIHGHPDGSEKDHANKKAAGANGGQADNGPKAGYHAKVADATEIERALRAIVPPGQVTEVRALDAVAGADRRQMTYSGYFDDPAAAAAAVVREIRSAAGIYFVPNPFHDGLLVRAVNRLRPAPKGGTTTDADVTRRHWLLVDLDPIRPSGISATDAEHEAALDRAREVAADMSARGWPDPVEADSGNGGHLMYRIDLPPDDDGLVERCLDALHAAHSDAAVKVDRTTHNPARIWKLYGTRAGKGDDAGDACGRPHRMARVLRVPPELRVVTREQLEALAGPPQPPASANRPPSSGRDPAAARASAGGTVSGNVRTFDLAGWLRDSGLAARGPEDWHGRAGAGRRWTFDVCPWNDAHADGSAYVVQLPSGAVEAGCHHDGCAGNDWHALRDKVEPGWRDRRAAAGGDGATRGAAGTADRTGGIRSGGSGGAPPAPVAAPPSVWPEPQPLPPELPPVMPFDFDLLPDALRPWVSDIAERVQCPPDFPAVGAVVALAGAVGRKVGIRPKRFDDWLVVANLWGAVIGRPGIMKTPALQEPLKPLKRLEVEAKRAYDEAAAEHELLAVVAEQQKEVAKKKIRQRLDKGEDAGAVAASIREAAAEAAADPASGDPAAAAPPVRRRHLVNDSTVEKLGEILNQNPNGVTVFRDELVGLLKSLDKEGQEGARAFFLEAWNGTGRYTYDRIGRGTLDIDAAVVSVLGGVQPGPLADYLRAAAQGGAGDDGLIQRFQLAVWPDVGRAWRNVDRWPDGDARRAANALFDRLDALEAADVGAERDEAEGPDAIPYLRFDPEAQDHFDAWRARLEHRLRSGEEHPAVESHLAKYRSLVPSLALLFHLADDGVGPVGAGALDKAVRWAEYLESHARRIYSPAVLSAAGAARALAGKIASGALADGFALKDMYHNGWSRLGSSKEAAAAVEVLVDLDWLAETVEGGTGGRNRKRYWVNPRAIAAATAKPAGATPDGAGGATGLTAKTAGRLTASDDGAFGGSGGAPAGPFPPRRAAGDGEDGWPTDGDVSGVTSGDLATVGDLAVAGPARERGRL